jgi:hypothetical protein
MNPRAALVRKWRQRRSLGRLAEAWPPALQLARSGDRKTNPVLVSVIFFTARLTFAAGIREEG